MKRYSIPVMLLLMLAWTPLAEADLCQNCYQKVAPLVGYVAICSTASPGDGYTEEMSDRCQCSTNSGRCILGSSYPCNANGTCGSTEDPDDTGIFNDDGGTSPIVVDLGNRGFELTGLDDPVEFDIDADGSVETITWTSAAGDDAFLVLDRNGNGAVDDGSELFGTAAEQPPSEEPNGYLALGVFDAAAEGGDGDGWITPADAVWSSLQLWSDLDHDGTAQPLELSSLDDFGIAGIELAYVDSQRRDRHGNLLRWASRVRFERGLRLAASDVIFVSR